MIKIKLTLEYGYYSKGIGDERAEKRFYSCGYERGTAGGGSPIDTKEGVIDYFKRAITKNDYGDEIDIKDSEIELIDKTELKLTIGEIRGNKWF